ncbi:related to EXO1 - exonuclease which interacts with Msh2p [Melanopsichium pennsylvanicum]|uniref:Related to EXO1 - exonuclease which interacts with Msh2p n=2 Tax=Melanopsichium pennsylvanicum TaxID=63383 RepID=A0AAJ4XNE7_9BASI|nr:related to EXO1-exonuclease which interacts with Msh2p [Melanopsichium pennsylvanicum 4]SNX85056.1 related to EXO1 - exonuclease which interacts with Msh2p [Melanopsichium pennsylvanicum]
MGIQGLLPLLKEIQTTVHVSTYAGKTLGVDAYVWLHRGAYGCAREIVLGDPTPRYIAHALSRIRMLQHFGVKPYLVFDGDKLPAKRGTEDDREQRRAVNMQKANDLEQQGKIQQARDVYSKCVDITPEMAYQLIKVLKEQGIPYVVAPYEADAQLAYLEAQGLIDGVITEDSDLLVFGCKTVLFKLDQAGNAVEMLQERFWTNRQLALSGWTPVEFRQMAILSGCDYLPSIVGMGLKNAHRLLRRYKTVDKVLQAVRLEGKMRVPPAYSREFRKAELTFVHQRVFDPSSQKLVTLTPLPDGTHDDMLPFIGAAMEDEVARGVAAGTIDPIARTPIVDRVSKSLGTRSSSTNNIASTSGTSGPHLLHRSTTLPTNLFPAQTGSSRSSNNNNDGTSSFYRASVGANSSSSAAKKKVISTEPGLQSLKSFFGGSSSSRGTTKAKAEPSKPKEERVPLAPRDTNRASPSASTSILSSQAESLESKPMQSKFFARKQSTPTSKSPVVSQHAKLDHAYLHLGGQLTPPKARQDPNDSGYWDDDCHDMHDFVKSSSPPQPSTARESQSLVMDTQELWQTQATESMLGSVIATQVVQSTASCSSALVVVPQTPLRGRKRMHSASTECDAILSSPESAGGSGFISSPASSSVQGGVRASARIDTIDGGESDTLSSSPLLGCRPKQSGGSEEDDDDDDDVVAEPATPLAARGGSARKPMLHTSASMSKLEAFRYSTSTPQQQQHEQRQASGRATLPRRSTDATSTAVNGTTMGLSMSPSVLKLRTTTSTPVESGARPNKMLKRSPTLLLGEEGEQKSRSSTVGSGGGSGTGGLFDKFRFSESTSIASTSLSRQFPF